MDLGRGRYARRYVLVGHRALSRFASSASLVMEIHPYGRTELANSTLLHRNSGLIHHQLQVSSAIVQSIPVAMPNVMASGYFLNVPNHAHDHVFHENAVFINGVWSIF